MDFFEAVEKRRSVRAYRAEPVPVEKLDRVLQACDMAPSAGNLQAYRIWVVTGEDTLERLDRAAFNQGFIRQAPVALVFCADPEANRRYGRRGAELYAVQDATIAASYAQLAATAQGLATCWVGAFDEGKAAEALGVDATLRPIVILPLGVAAEEPAAAPRRGVESLVTRA